MACQHAFRPVSRAAMGAVRHIFTCSRPHHHHPAMEVEDDDISIDGDIYDDRGGLEGASSIEKDANHANLVRIYRQQSMVELHAVLRHLEVRWQLFNESLSKFHDPEAMLANCTDDVVWNTENGEMIKGKSQELLSLLCGLIERKVSLEVEVECITRITPSGLPDLLLDKHGHCGAPSIVELARATSVLKALGLIDSTSHSLTQSTTLLGGAMQGSAAASPSSPPTGGRQAFLILAQDNYTLKSIEGEVEKGKRAVLWQQHKSSWYIRGYLCY